MLEIFHADLDALGFRRRRFHDARRTFVSVALGDGAHRDMLRWVTHDGDGSVLDGYTSPPWPSLCEAVAVLRVRRRPTDGGEVVPLPVLAPRGGGG